MRISRNKALFITNPNSAFWLRVYRRGSKYFALGNFLPSAYPSLINELEHLVHLEQISNYSETAMGVFVFSCMKGLPIVDIQKALLKLNGIQPKEVIHYGQAQQS